MTTPYKTIRAALETKLASITGIPEISWENRQYSPTTGTPFVRVSFIPTVSEPAVRGLSPQMYYQGMLTVDCCVPEGFGPAEADDLADLILNAFPATSDVTYGDFVLPIRYSERGQGLQNGVFYMVPVTIGWYLYQ